MYASNQIETTTHHQKKQDTGIWDNHQTESTCYFEVDMTQPEGASLYSGFTQEIDGVFIPTYDLKPIGHPAALKLKFKGGRTIALRGYVEWIREDNILTPETHPGLGIRFVDCDARDRALIEKKTTGQQSLFFEGSCLQRESPLTTEDAVIEERDTTGSALFFYNMIHDLVTLLEQNEEHRDGEEALLHTAFSNPRQGIGSSDTVAVLNRRPDHVLHATVIHEEICQGNFHGGFNDDDKGYRLFIATETPPPIGSQLSVRLRLPSGWHLTGSGEVKWRRRHNPMVSKHLAPAGVGVCLTDITPTAWRNAFPHQHDPHEPVICETC